MKWTEEQLKEFDELTRNLSSLAQMDRIQARLDFPAWKDKNGFDDAALDEMFAELKKRDKRV